MVVKIKKDFKEDKMKTKIPEYRAKKIDSDEYVEGYFSDFNKSFIVELKTQRPFTVDPSTLAIHFPDMIDSEGNKIFASLSEDGKGGGMLFYEDGLEEFVAEFTSNGFALYEYLDNKTIKNRVYQQNAQWYNLKVTGIQE